MLEFSRHRHHVAAVSVMVIQGAFFVVRIAAGSVGMVILIVMMVIAMMMHVHGRENLAGIRAQGAPLETGEHAEHKQPNGNTPHQRTGPSSLNGRNSSKKPAMRSGVTAGRHGQNHLKWFHGVAL